MRELLADRDIRLSLFARTLSTLGDNALWIALGIWVKILTGSASAAGLCFFTFTLGMMCAPAGGLLIDRRRRRPLITVLNLLAALLVLPLLLVRGRSDIWLIYTVMFGYGVLTGVIGGAQSAITQTLVPEELLAGANGLLQTLQQGLRLATPLLGAGVLAAFGVRPLVIGDAVTFVVAAALTWALAVREERPTRSQEPLMPQLTEGVRYIAVMPMLRRLVVATMLAIVAFGLSESVDFAVVGEGLHRSPAFLGVLNSGTGVGGIAAGVVAARLMRTMGESSLVALGLVTSGAGFALMAAPSLPAVLSGGVLIGVSLPWIISGLMTAFQRQTPARLMGRVNTALNVLISAPQTAAIAVGAGLVAVADFRLLLAAMTALMLLAAAYLWIRRAPGALAVAVVAAGTGDPSEPAEPAAAG